MQRGAREPKSQSPALPCPTASPWGAAPPLLALGTSLSRARALAKPFLVGLCSLCLNCHYPVLSGQEFEPWQLCAISRSLTVLGLVVSGSLQGCANPAGCCLCPVGLPGVFPAAGVHNLGAQMLLCEPGWAVGPSLLFWGCCELWASLPSLQPSNPSAHEAQKSKSLCQCHLCDATDLPWLFHPSAGGSVELGATCQRLPSMDSSAASIFWAVFPPKPRAEEGLCANLWCPAVPAGLKFWGCQPKEMQS